jgi:transposase-like protein
VDQPWEPCLAQSRRRAECGAGAAPNTPASIPHCAADPAVEISRFRRENDRLRLERDILKKLWPSSRNPEMRFCLIENQRGVWPVRVMCDALNVS